MSEKNGNKNKFQRQGGKSLDDATRVKVLSPGMMVFKRFIRNKLAIVGLCIIAFMFVFSFFGGLFTPYRQDQVFFTYLEASKDYAGAVENDEFRYTNAGDVKFTSADSAKFILALNEQKTSFESLGVLYGVIREGEDFYRVTRGEEIASFMFLAGAYNVTVTNEAAATDELIAAAEAAIDAKQTEFTFEDGLYTIARTGKNYTLQGNADVALASKLIYDPFDPSYDEVISTFAFRLACERAVQSGDTTFEAAGVTYLTEAEGEEGALIRTEDGKEFANVSRLIVNPVANDIFLTVDFKAAVADAISENRSDFVHADAEGNETNYRIKVSLGKYVISRSEQTYQINRYEAPSKTHVLGTDTNGMDVLTRLMYGGRISLLVGFVVVILELLLGVIIGGVSGYFGKWVDTLLMRFVDLFNCIPYYPVMIIAGAIMDSYQVDSYIRIFMLMAIMGLMGWTGVARVVRGQILSLREQDFMIATEACGISIKRRIFRHLVPNVMPLLIVQATMGLGSIILTEATLSFLGLGVKYPLASWGSIINAATNLYVMTNFWFIWIPAGLLILLTVLGFNFVGDGLRDAFDPRMKR